MSKEMIIATSPHETKVALLEEGQVVEICVEREQEVGLVGSIYKGRVTRVLPGMQSAFVHIGLDRDAFLYVSDFVEALEELDDYDRPLTAADTEEPPAGTEAAAPPPPEESQPVPQRQPAFAPSEPPLRLPERRPLGRAPRSRRHHRHRGGRGRWSRDRGARPEPHRPRPQPPAGDQTYEPIILPGESLAKYRDRVPPPPPAQPKPAEPSQSREAESPGDVSNRKPPNGPIRFPDETPKAENSFRREEPPANSGAQLASGEPLPVEPSPSAAESATREEPQQESSLVSESRAARVEKARSPEAPEENYPDATTLAEIERVRRYEGEVGLPPSVHERTAGGVEWARPRGGSGRRRPRLRRPRWRRARPERASRRPMHARPTQGQPPIAELLKPGQEIIVQIAKEQMGKKGARITSHITLPGRFLVYMPTIDHLGISRKIGTREERARLRRLLLELKGTISGGFVVRTAAAGSSEEALREDLDYLVKLWHEIRMRAEENPAPALLHGDLNLVDRMLRDHLTPEYESIWIDSQEEYAKVVEFVGRLQPSLANRVKLYTKHAPIFEELGVQQEIDRALRPKVWLKSGGYIVINHTEALVAIDVNTGKFVGKGSTRLEDTIVKTNLEAVREVVRQIRLRDLGGIIIIDFIDMEDPRNRHRVMHAIEEALRGDRAPSKLLSFNEFGLVAITRKRTRQSLERVLCQPCPYCVGTGMLKSVTTLCYEIQGEARKMAEAIDAPELTIRAHPEIVRALKGRDHTLVRELEQLTGKNIILQADTTLHFDQYNIY